MNQQSRDDVGHERPQPDEGAFDQDFGASLRRARERRGISLRSIAVSTRISLTFLEALERNEVSRLPGGIFARSFVRSYAEEVGLDPKQVVQAFIERFPAEDSEHATGHVHEFDDGDDIDSRRATASVALKLMGVSIPIAAALLYFMLSGGPGAEPQPEVSAQAPEASATLPAPSRTSAVAAIGDEGREASSAAPLTASTVSESNMPGGVAVGGMGGALGVTISTTGACWVSVRADGRRSFTRLMEAGEQQVLQVRDEIVIEVGDAGNFSFSINGVAGRSLGEVGEAVTARINTENYESFLRP